MIVVVGSGYAGAATAWWLARRGHGSRTVLLEAEAEAGRHASGSNAGLIASLSEDDVTCSFTARGAGLLRDLLGGGARGSALLAAAESDLAVLREQARRHGVPTDLATTGVLARRIPILEGAPARIALLCPRDRAIEPRAVLERYVREAREAGVRVLAGARVTALETGSGRVRAVVAGAERIAADRVVDAAGAWAEEVAHLAGLRGLGLRSYRRHLFVSEEMRGLDGAWPFVWDLGGQTYFRADGGRLTLSPCDEEPHAAAPPRVSEGAAALMRRKLSTCFPALAAVGLERARACLRTFAPDRRYVIGPDPRLDGFFWVAGLGGSGATAAAAVGELAADLLVGGRAAPGVAAEVAPARLLAAADPRGGPDAGGRIRSSA